MRLPPPPYGRPWRSAVSWAFPSSRRRCSPSSPRLDGDVPAAAASSQQALSLFRNLPRYPSEAAFTLNELGLVQQLTGDYPAAAASHQQALALSRDAGNRAGQAKTLNSLGELASRTADGRQARDYHAQALAIARASSAPPPRKHGPWKASGTATSATATPAKPPPAWSKP